MKPASAKAKGRLLQQHVAKLIVNSFFGLDEADVVSRPMGSGGADLMMSPFAQRTFPVSTECKNVRTHPGPAALEQAAYNAYPGTIPVVAWKPPRKGMEETLAILKYVDLIRLVQMLRNN